MVKMMGTLCFGLGPAPNCSRTIGLSHIENIVTIHKVIIFKYW